MEQMQKDACAGSRVPVILLTGQSGSGKSTALGELLASVPAHVEVAVRRQMNNELNFSLNSEGLVLGCIDAEFCK